jgi:hypothetical protein
MGIGIDSTTLLVNANAVPIPHKWSEEHHTVTGYHKFKVGDDAERDAVSDPALGMPFIRDDLTEPRIDYYNGSAWVPASSSGIIPSGSKMLFIQDTVPTGWTLDVSANDKVIRVVDVEASGGVTGGSWTISGFQADDHALIEDEMPAHRHHSIGEVTAGWPFGNTGEDNMGSNGGIDYDNPFYNTSTTGGGAAADDSPGPGLPHDHTVSNDGVWRPSYINAIICIKD